MAKSSNDTLYGVLSYLGLLVIIPLLLRPKSAFAKAHMKQGLALLIGWGIGWLLAATMILAFLVPIWNLVLLICSLVGIVKVLQGKTWKLPLIGDTAAGWKL